VLCELTASLFNNDKARVQKFNNMYDKRGPPLEEDVVNPDFVEVDRILDQRKGANGDEYLVKWQVLHASPVGAHHVLGRNALSAAAYSRGRTHNRTAQQNRSQTKQSTII
jgi:hypothetical protein